MFAGLALALLAVQASAAEYTLYHRYVAPDAEFVPRGTVNVDGAAASFAVSSASGSSSLPSAGDSAWYQVALGLDNGDMITASTPSCFADTGVLTVHLTDDRVSGIEFKPAGDDACTTAAGATLPSSAVKVDVHSPQIVKSPPLSTPPPVDVTGKKVEPEVEKTFLQKYWVAIVAFMLFFASQMSDEPRGGRDGAEGGQATAPAK